MSHIISTRATLPIALAKVPPAPSLSITGYVSPGTIAEVVVLVVFYFITLLCILLRIYVRLKKDGRFFLNDYAILWAFGWGSTITFVCLAEVLQGTTGFHSLEILELVPERIVILGKLFLTAEISWAPANAGVKISIIDLYIKIFGTNRKFRNCAYVLLGCVVIYCIVAVLIILLICTPLAYNWDPFIKGRCGNEHEAFLATGVMNLILDLCVVILPMPLLWGLQMPMRKKFGIAFMFSIGFLICAITIWRIIIIQDLDFFDPYVHISNLVITSCLEPLLGIVNSCLPILRGGTGILIAPFLSIKSTLGGWTRGGTTARSASKGTSDSKPSAENGNSDGNSNGRNYNRLYDHLHSPSKTGATSQVTADPIELQSRFSRHADDGEDKIKLTTAWDVESGGGHYQA